MTIGCNIWMICLKSNVFFYDPSHLLQLSQFVCIKTFIPVSRIFGNEDDIFIFSRNVWKQVVKLNIIKKKNQN